MRKKFIRSLKVLNSRPVRFILSILLFVVIVFSLYSSIPSPSVDDGYSLHELRKVSFNAPFTIHFSQDMDKKSVENHFSIFPEINGRINWVDDNILEYWPEEALQIGDEYRIQIDPEVKNRYLKEAGDKIELRFIVAKAPFVKFVSPYPRDITKEAEDLHDEGFLEGIPGEEDVFIISPDQKVTVMFDRPIRALSIIDYSSKQDFPRLEINPPVKGEYNWVGTTAFQFVPEKWVMGTIYTLRVPKGVRTLDGGKTDADIIWQVATEEPKAIKTVPAEGSDIHPVSGDIRLEFNQEMNIDFIKPGGNVQIFPSNDKDADKEVKNDGFFNTTVVYGKNDEGKVDKKIILFKPEFPFLFDQEYEFVIKKGLQGGVYKLEGLYGQRMMKDDLILHFKTAKKPGISEVTPKNGSGSYDEDYIFIDFDSPMSEEVIKEHLLITPELKDDIGIYMYEEGRRAEIYADFDPSTKYSVEFTAPFEDLAGNTCEKGVKSDFKTAQEKGTLSLLSRGNYGFFTEGLDPVYPIKTMNVDSVDVKYCKIDQSDFFRVSGSYNWYNYRCQSPIHKRVGIKSKLNKPVTTELDLRNIFGREFNIGIYFFEVSSEQAKDYEDNPVRKYHIFMVSNTVLTIKKAEKELLVWATDIITGEPVEGMDISIRTFKGEEAAFDITDKNGVFKINKHIGDNIFVAGNKKSEARWSLVSQYWSDGIQPWNFDAFGDWVEQGAPRIYLYTERPIYRPGDTLFFKGIYRIDQDADLSLPDDEKIRVAIEDPEYNEVYEKEVYLLADGSFSGSIELDENIRLGRSNIYAELADSEYSQRFYHHFFVEEYKKPKFKVELLGPLADFFKGEEIPIDISANYYFGGAIRNGKAKWTVMREPYFFQEYKGKGYYSFSIWDYFECLWMGCGAEPEIVHEGEGVLDEKGLLHISVPTDQEAKDGVGFLYTVNAEIENKDGEFVSGRKTFIVHQGSYSVGVNVKKYVVARGEDAILNVVSAAHNGEPVAGKDIELDLYREKWNTVKKQGVDGGYYEESEKELELIEKKSITTTEKPVEVSFYIRDDMKGGRYIVIAKGDDGKRTILAETGFYVSSDSYVDWGASNNNRMEITADQPEYFVGGKAKILIQSPYGSPDNPAKALMTYERGGIHSYKLIDIKGNSDITEVPITEDMAPNIYVSVIVMKDIESIFEKYLNSEDIAYELAKPDFKMGVVNLIVNKREKEILLDIETDKPYYNTGDDVIMEIHTRDYRNKPIPSLVSLAVVDESILALKANTKVSPLDYFFGNRQLQVTTASNLTIHVDRIDVASQKGAKGGGGAGDMEGFEKKRGEFKDTAYFNPLIETDEGGYAKVTFKAPDNLTTWEIWAVANSGEDLFGMKKKDFIVKKPLAITPILPRFAVSGDSFSAGALVHNQTDVDAETEIKISSSGLEITDKSKKTVFIKAGQSERVEWEVKALSVLQDSIKDIEISAEANSGLRDIVAIQFPFHIFSVSEVTAVNGTVKNEHTESVYIPERIVKSMGELIVRVGGSPVARFISSFEALMDYSYGCAEQIISKAIPHLMIRAISVNEGADLYGFLGIMEEDSIAFASSALQKLVKFQRFDGGYGFWERAESSNPMLTSYILFAQKLAKDGGFAVPQESIDESANYLWAILNDPETLSLGERAFALWVLSELDKNDTGMAISLYEKLDEMPLYARSILLMNLKNLYDAGQKSVYSTIEKLKANIVKNQITHDRSVHFEEREKYCGDMSTDRRTTAVTLMALNRDNPENPLLPQIVSYLVSTEGSFRFVNTQETAWVLMSMLEYSIKNKVLSADYRYEVDVNNKKIMEGAVDSSDLAEFSEVSIPIADMDAESNIFFKKEGEGVMDFNMLLKYYVPNESVEAIEKGFYVHRSYYPFENVKEEPVKKFASGEIYRGELTVIVPEDMHYAVIEERLPAGFEAINFNLDTSDVVLEARLSELNNPKGNYFFDNPLWYFNHREIRDDRVLLFADYLPKGVYTYNFLIRAGLPGRYHHLPATAYQMYYPEVFGRTGGGFVLIKN